MTYDLYFLNTLVAKIQNVSIAFLNCYGNYVLDADFLREHKDSTIMKMIAFQVKNADNDELDDEEFTDLIESEDWYLLDETGKKSPILVPLFNNKTDITWRYNVDYD
jgi:hypothetical protein